MVYSNKFVMCVLLNGEPVSELANGEVHIPFGAEYVLRFRNKNDRRAVVKFTIDGENVSGNGYIIPAKDYIDVKRHNDRDAAFKLVTLNSPEAVDAGKNGPNTDKSKGVIEATFVLEKERKKPVEEIHHHHHHHHDLIPRNPYNPWNPKPYWCKDTDKSTTISKGFLRSRSTAGGEESPVSLCSMGFSSEPSCEPSPTVQDGCTVEGYSTGQRFTSSYIDIEETGTVLRIFLRGLVSTSIRTAPCEVQKFSDRDSLDDEEAQLEQENNRLKEEIQKKRRLKELEREKKRLLKELENL